MCYHISLAAGPAELAARYGRKADLIERFKPLYHVSAFSYPEYPVVTSDLEIELFRWGLIPFWADELEDAFELRYRTFNARAETVFTKPAFRKPIRRTRCLVPVTGFFEWRHEDDRRIPLLRRSGRRRHLLAGRGVRHVAEPGYRRTRSRLLRSSRPRPTH